jgi:hypothetical protein
MTALGPVAALAVEHVAQCEKFLRHMDFLHAEPGVAGGRRRPALSRMTRTGCACARSQSLRAGAAARAGDPGGEGRLAAKPGVTFEPEGTPSRPRGLWGHALPACPAVAP